MKVSVGGRFIGGARWFGLCVARENYKNVNSANTTYSGRKNGPPPRPETLAEQLF